MTRRLVAVVAAVAAAFGSVGAAQARPTQGAADPERNGYTVPSSVHCTLHVCVHWVESSQDSPWVGSGAGEPGLAPTDADSDSVPDWIETVAQEWERAWAVEVTELGFRAPLADTGAAEAGPDARLDVYLADTGAGDEYGYCVSDDPDDPRVDPSSTYRYRDFSVYCVIDDDYVESQFGSATFGLAALRVTAAHELFHAIQCAYDCYEDPWLVEGTAGWMEEMVHDDINNVYDSLDASPIGKPQTPLDWGDGEHPYGAWVFWEYFSDVGDRLAEAAQVRAVWERAAADPLSGDGYSLQAADAVVEARGGSFGSLFRDFAVANRRPEAGYDDMSDERYPRVRPQETYGLGPARKRIAATRRLDHLSNRYIRFRPRRTGSGARLRVAVDAYAGAPRAYATVLVERAGRTSRTTIDLDASGRGAAAVPFNSKRIASVVLVLTNASTRFDCAYETSLSCGGYPLDDDKSYTFRARVLNP